ncbi:MAG: VTT domain-containing protein [Saprospiraceae bacterium]|nr:VTT domain-containing protein [Saprospiraceae bacterium]
MRQFWLFLVLVTLVLLPFIFWGEELMNRFTLDGSIAWLGNFGEWAWLGGIGLLVADIIMPIPGTLVMSALGYIYGTIIGGLFAALGSFASGTVGYWICRSLGEKGAIKILGKKGYVKGRVTFDRVGGWMVVLSRWLPVFPEVISCMAGLNRMSPVKFHLALLCSAIPMGFIYAIIGQAGMENPTLAIVLSAGLPPVIWLIINPIFKKMS